MLAAQPIKQVYITCNCNTGQMMWDPMAVIQAVEGDALFAPSATGNSRYQLPGSADWNAWMLEKIRRYNRMM